MDLVVMSKIHDLPLVRKTVESVQPHPTATNGQLPVVRHAPRSRSRSVTGWYVEFYDAWRRVGGLDSQTGAGAFGLFWRGHPAGTSMVRSAGARAT